MAKKSKREIEEIRQRQHVEMMSFSRFMFFRYVATFFFFVNLYWSIVLVQAHEKMWVLPLLLIIAIFPTMWEQFKKLHDLSNRLLQTKIYFWVQMITNIVLIFVCLTPLYFNFYPFMHADEREIVIGILLVGILFCFYAERKAYKIENNQDKYYKHLKRAKEAADKNIKKLNV